MYYSIYLKYEVKETGNIFKKNPILDYKNYFYLDKFLITIEQLKKNKNIKKILIVYEESFSCYPGQLEQIYSMLKSLKVNGKELYFFAKSYDEKAFYISGLCQNRLIPRGGILMFLGYKFEFNYFKQLLDQHKIEVEIYRRGKYKGAADRFRLDQIDEEQKEAYGLILKRIYEIFTRAVTENFNWNLHYFEEKIMSVPLTAEEGKELGIITEILNFQTLLDQWKKEKNKKAKISSKRQNFGKGWKTALLIFEGTIKDGSNSKSLFQGQSIGDCFYIKQIEKIRKNKAIKSVIFKVDSPGGSATASDALADALSDLRNEKDLVVVQSGVAGSGGYYISFPGEKIFSQNTTITGSIGVINMLFFIRNLAENYGITHSVLKEGDHADVLSGFRERSNDEKKMIDTMIESFYHLFVKRVSDSRNRSFDDIDSIAQGRIWSGLDGINAGIVDEIEDIYTAMDYIREKNKVKNISMEIFPKPKTSLLFRLLSIGETNEDEPDAADISMFFNNPFTLELGSLFLNINKKNSSIPLFYIPENLITLFKM